jgi:hypothetical protein
MADPTVEGLREHFRLVSYRMPVPAGEGWTLTLDGPCFQCVSEAADGRTTFASYEDGLLKMEIRHQASSIVANHNGAGCTPPMDHLNWTAPEGCVLRRDIDVPVRIQVSVPMPEPGDRR